MTGQRIGVYGICGLLMAVSSPSTAVSQQIPLNPTKASGQTVTPAFEGWYRNPDGSFSLSFGYFNRNGREIVEIPVGPNNKVEPGNENQGQPTSFSTQRHFGVFAVKVPKDFGDKNVTWTVTVRGQTYAIPGHLRPNWEIDALAGEAGSGNTPPGLRFAENGPTGAGPGGITVDGGQTTVGTALPITVFVSDDGRPSSSVSSDGRANSPVTLTWFKHQGPGAVTFTPPTTRVDSASRKVVAATVSATFSAPGDYIVRLRATEGSITGSGHAQCCWSNGFVKVRVK
jgi:hypothetical protein